jgi:uncharacterized protein YcbK (DUF882 family)
MTEHFSREEFRCKGVGCCGNSSPISLELLENLELLRKAVSEELGKNTPLKINSGFRCKTHNRKIGGSANSEHVNGIAADVATPNGITDERFSVIAEKVPAFRDGGIGLYKGRIHVDCRKSGRARWKSM